ncbi:MAG TPA: hypothetical protein VMD79_12690 [Solirubrobacteraceae bacterium]|nr:hypothetical protein [Solirubrobacteraceae bacterium]
MDHLQLATRRKESEEGLALVRQQAAEHLSSIVSDEPLAIYVTGSFGRLEARFPEGSDLDLFFLYGPRDRSHEKRPSQLTWFELAGELIRIARRLRFEEFSRDGAFLQAHNVWHIGRQLGSQHEDSENGFTARLLLLLESRYVLNEHLYRRFMEETIGFYYGDYSANRGTFRPTFLINDILRFWRTLCLNYEHKRNRKRSDSAVENDNAPWRADSALDNLKLRFSRLSTCYSMVIALAAEPTPVGPERVLELCSTAPTDRWSIAAQHASAGAAAEAGAKVEQILEAYDAFLELMGDEDALRERLTSHAERASTRRRAAAFGQLVSEFLLTTCQGDQLRTLLI